MRWCSGSACIVVVVRFLGKKLFTHLVECMNLYNIWIHINDEFSINSYIFCTLNIGIHTNMNSYYVWIHILFAVIMYEFIYFLQCKKKAASARKPRARTASARKLRACTASAQRKLRGQSPSSPPAPTRPHPAALTVRVACGSPDS